MLPINHSTSQSVTGALSKRHFDGRKIDTVMWPDDAVLLDDIHHVPDKLSKRDWEANLLPAVLTAAE